MKLTHAAWIAAISVAIAGCSWNKTPESTTQKAAQDAINATCARLDSVPEIRDILKAYTTPIAIRFTWLEAWVANYSSTPGWTAISIPISVGGKVSGIMDPGTLCTYKGNISGGGDWQWSYNTHMPKDSSARLARDLNVVIPITIFRKITD